MFALDAVAAAGVISNLIIFPLGIFTRLSAFRDCVLDFTFSQRSAVAALKVLTFRWFSLDIP